MAVFKVAGPEPTKTRYQVVGKEMPDSLAGDKRVTYWLLGEKIKLELPDRPAVTIYEIYREVLKSKLPFEDVKDAVKGAVKSGYLKRVGERRTVNPEPNITVLQEEALPFPTNPTGAPTSMTDFQQMESY